jgi:hypothetical protein
MAKRAGIDPSIFTTPGPFRVGDRVRISRGGEPIEGTVVEDRGPLGPGGTRVYGITFRMAEVPDEVYVERLVNEMTLVARAPDPAGKPRRKKRPSE